MPLSTTGLHEGDFTILRVLKNGVMQDVLSLTASGSPDIPLGSLTVAHTAGLQTQLNAKATTAALSTAAESLGAEIDVLETGVSAVGAAVASLGAAVDLKQDRIGDGSLTVAMTNGLQTRLDDIRDIQSATQASVGSASQQLVYR
jgi:hypothetical protein